MVIKDKRLEEVIEEQRLVDAQKTHFQFKISDIHSWDTEHLTFNIAGDRTLTSYALKQLLKKLKIPYSYFMACSPELRDKELREAMESANSRTDYIFKVYRQGEADERIYGLVPPQYYPALTVNFMDRIREALPTDVTLSEFSVSLDEMRLRIISGEKSFIEKDKIIPAVDITYSEVGKCPYAVKSSLYRVVCSNGMMLPEGLSPSVKIPLTRFSEAQFQSSLFSLGDTFEKQKSFAETLERLKEIPLPDRLDGPDELPAEMKDAINLVIPSKIVQRDYTQLILNEYTQAENFSVNGLVNALTRTARDIQDNSEKSSLELLAGSFVSRVHSLDVDHKEHNQELEYTVPNLRRLFKRHA